MRNPNKISRNSEWKPKLRNRNLIVEKHKGVPDKKDRPTNHILTIFLTLNNKGATNKHQLKSYAMACMRHNVAKPYNKF